MTSTKFIIANIIALASSVAMGDQHARKPVITLGEAKSAVGAVLGDNSKVPYALSIVDDGGHLIYLERGNGVASGMPEASILKAQSSAYYGVTTKVLEDQINERHSGFLNLPHALPMEGGVPIFIGGSLAGAVGVAGGISADDGELAKRIAAALAK